MRIFEIIPPRHTVGGVFSLPRFLPRKNRTPITDEVRRSSIELQAGSWQTGGCATFTLIFIFEHVKARRTSSGMAKTTVLDWSLKYR